MHTGCACACGREVQAKALAEQQKFYVPIDQQAESEVQQKFQKRQKYLHKLGYLEGIDLATFRL
jgi:hypothetical protein